MKILQMETYDVFLRLKNFKRWFVDTVADKFADLADIFFKFILAEQSAPREENEKRSNVTVSLLKAKKMIGITSERSKEYDIYQSLRRGRHLYQLHQRNLGVQLIETLYMNHVLYTCGRFPIVFVDVRGKLRADLS